MASDPLTLFRSALRAIAAEDWHGLARLCDPDGLRVFADHVRRQYVHRPLDRDQLLRSYRVNSPDMPREVAEYNVDAMIRTADPGARLRQEFPSLSSPEALESLAADTLFAMWCERQSPREQARQAVASGRVPAEHVADAVGHASGPFRLTALGAVHDGPRIAHVIYRPWLPGDGHEGGPGSGAATDGAPSIEAVESRSDVSSVVCIRGDDGEWRLVARPGMFGLGFLTYHISAHFEGGLGG